MSRLDLLADVAAMVREMKWADQALCAETDPEAFFPEKGAAVSPAKRICLSCPVRTECLDYALEHEPRWGVWGGKSVHERERIRRERQAAA